jgi:penicillin-binding protein 1A
MALPIWGMYMKSCYADEDLNISIEDFEEPANLSIRVDCDKEADSPKDDPIIYDEGPDELDM